MGILNPIENSFIKTLAQTQSSLQALVTTTQANFVNWLEFNPSEFSRTDANTITLNTDLSKQVQVGDKIRIKQTGTYRYFWLIYEDSTTWRIAGGDNFTFANEPIEEIAISKIVNPEGFPDATDFVYAGMDQILAIGATGSTVSGLAKITFEMQLGFLVIFIETTTSATTSGNAVATDMFTEIPIPLRPASGFSTDIVAYPANGLGIAQNTTWTEDILGCFSLFSSLNPTYSSPEYIKTNLYQRGIRKFGNPLGSSSFNSIQCEMRYKLLT